MADWRTRLIEERAQGMQSLGQLQRCAAAEAVAARVQARCAYEYESPNVVYFMGGSVGGINIGTSSNVYQRFIDIQSKSTIDLRVLAVTEGSYRRENEYHCLFGQHWLGNECFAAAEPILSEIERLNSTDAICRAIVQRIDALKEHYWRGARRA